MATLTYDANEQVEGELNADEQESLEVGEKLAEQQEQLLAGKFKDAEDLEKAYIELQGKLGKPKEEEAEAESEEKPEATEKSEEKSEEIDTSLLDTLWDEAGKGNYTDETLDKLSQFDSRDIAQMHLKYRSENPQQTQQELSDGDVKDLKGIVGGDDGYQNMMQWAGKNLSDKEQQMYDAVMEKGDPLSAFFAVQALQYRFNDAVGVEGEMLTGKAASNKGDVFRSQAEVVRAMSDPKYDKDPAYRQDIYNKLERSNINF